MAALCSLHLNTSGANSVFLCTLQCGCQTNLIDGLHALWSYAQLHPLLGFFVPETLVLQVREKLAACLDI